MSNLSSYGYGLSDTDHLGVAAYGYGQGVPLGLVANLDLLTTLNAGLEVPSSVANLLQATLGLETDLDASLQFITIGELLTSLDLTTTFSSVLQFIPLQELLASLDLEFGSQAILDPPIATVKGLESILGLEVELVTAFLVPPKIIVDQRLLFGGLGPPPPGFLEFLQHYGPFLSAKELGAAPPEFQEYLKRDLNAVGAFTSGYIFFPVLSVQFKPSDDGPELEPKLIVIGEPQEISYEPPKSGGATLFKP